MVLELPEGARIAVSIGADFDAQSLWMGTFGEASQGLLSRGEFGAEVGVPRLLDTFENFRVRTMWCTPTHSVQTFPAAVEAILERGHEIAARGVYHEPVLKLEPNYE